jgi:hypothetical protein
MCILNIALYGTKGWGVRSQCQRHQKKDGKACQRLLGPNAVTAQVRLAKYVIKGSSGFSIFVPGDLHTNNLGDFLAVRYNGLLYLCLYYALPALILEA